MVLQGPIYLGDEVRVNNRAAIYGPAVVGDRTVIDGEARINRSIIGQNCFIGPGLEVHESIIGPQSNLVATSFSRAQAIPNEIAAPATVTAHPPLASRGWSRRH